METPQKSQDDKREEELLREAATLREELREATAAAKKLRGENPEPELAQQPADSETTPHNTFRETPTTSPQAEEINNFIKEMNIEGILPPEFNDLTEPQQLKVVRDLKRRIVDIVKSDAQTQYSEEMRARLSKDKGIFKLVGKLDEFLAKESEIKKTENKVFEKIKNTDDGKKIIIDDLQVLVKRTAEQDIRVWGNNHYVSYIRKLVEPDSFKKNYTSEDWKKLSDFNIKADFFSQIPYEWGQEKKGEHRKAYDEAKAEYEMAREEVLKIETSKEKPEETGKAMLEMLEIDNTVQMEQLLNTHPEFEQALEKFTESKIGFIEGTKQFFNKMSGGSGANRQLMAGGFAARMAARGAAIFTASTALTFIAAPVVGGVVGGLRGRYRAQETLKENKKQARYGKKDASVEANNTVDAENLSKRLEDLIQSLNKALSEATSSEEIGKRLDQLARRITFTQNKIEQGLVNFGDTKSSLNNQFNLTNNLNQALVTSGSLNETHRKDIDERLQRFLDYKTNKISEVQQKFIKDQIRRGIMYGAGAATAGYALRYVGEQLGWFGHHGTAVIHNKDTVALTGKVTPHEDTSEDFITRTENWLRKIKFWEHHDKVETHAAKDIELKPDHTDLSSETSPDSLPNSTSTPPHFPNLTEAHQPENIDHDSLNNIFADKSVSFEVGSGKGGIEGIVELKNQLTEAYHGDFSHAPQSIQDFMQDPSAVKQAIKLGLYDPNNPNESALIKGGSILKFDKDGNLLFGIPDKSGNIPILEKFTGQMFHSGHESMGANNTDHVSQDYLSEKRDKIFSKIKFNGEQPSTKISGEHIIETPKTPDVADIRQSVLDKLHHAEAVRETSSGPGGKNYFFDTNPDRIGMTEGFSQPGSVHIDSIFETHPDFVGKNPFHLTAGLLQEVYTTYQKNIEHLLPQQTSEQWRIIGGTKVSELYNDKSLATDTQDQIFPPMYRYLHRLTEVTGLKPRNNFWSWSRPETVEEFVKRSLQKAATIAGGLDRLKLE